MTTSIRVDHVAADVYLEVIELTVTETPEGINSISTQALRIDHGDDPYVCHVYGGKTFVFREHPIARAMADAETVEDN